MTSPCHDRLGDAAAAQALDAGEAVEAGVLDVAAQVEVESKV